MLVIIKLPVDGCIVANARKINLVAAGLQCVSSQDSTSATTLLPVAVAACQEKPPQLHCLLNKTLLEMKVSPETCQRTVGMPQP